MTLDVDAVPDAWRKTCLRFFKDDSDEAVRQTLSFFDDHFIYGKECLPAEKAVNLLKSCSLLKDNRDPAHFNPDKLALYVAVKNSARSEAHQQLLAERKQLLSELLRRHGLDTALPEGLSHTPPETSLLSSRKRERSSQPQQDLLCNFVGKHRSMIGSHPFLKSLAQLIQLQCGDQMVWRWTFLEEALTEAGGHVFLVDGVQLLATLFQRVAETEVLASTGPGYLAFEFPIEVPDWQLSKLLKVLPSEAKLEGSATGEFFRTTVLRTRSEDLCSSDDPAELLRSCLRRRCNIL